MSDKPDSPREEGPTPETDAFNDNWDSYNFPMEAVNFARSLERRLQEAQRKLQIVRDAANELRTELMIAVRDRDAALREVEEHKRDAVVYITVPRELLSDLVVYGEIENVSGVSWGPGRSHVERLAEARAALAEKGKP